MFMINELIMLPTKYPSKLAARGFAYLGGLHYMELEFIKSPNYFPQYLYILTNAEIKEGDWCMIKDEPQQVKSFNASVLPELKHKYGDTLCTCYNIQIGYYECFPESLIGKKIIATTDPSLNLPEIPKSFIEYFIAEWNKGNKIEKVEVEYKSGRLRSYGRGFTPSSILINPDNTITINI